MKICLVGHFGDTFDEGTRNVGKALAGELRKRSYKVDMLNMSSLKTFKDLFFIQPDVVHFVLTPTWQGIVVSKLMSLCSPRAKIIVSAMHPSIPPWALLRLFRPDVALTQSKESKKLFESIGFNTSTLFNGVDMSRFHPVDEQRKRELRVKYGIPVDQFVILHLASLKTGRNLGIFKVLQKMDGNTCLIIGRENENYDKDVVEGLKESNCLVWIKHFPNIEDIYGLSDCYLFPTVDKKACIETPLSVLEAMACNLPVVTTEFGSLPEIFQNGSGVFYIKAEDDYLKVIGQIKRSETDVKTREMVMSYSWENIVKALEEIYQR